jgi:hypothetical protein
VSGFVAAKSFRQESKTGRDGDQTKSPHIEKRGLFSASVNILRTTSRPIVSELLCGDFKLGLGLAMLHLDASCSA